MRIILFQFYSKKPNPVYQELAAALRRKGHEVWLAEPAQNGDLLLKNQNEHLPPINGPVSCPPQLAQFPLLPKLFSKWATYQFNKRIRRILLQIAPDIVQVNPPPMAWMLPLFMPQRIHFIQDIRQINEAVHQNWLTRLREKMAVWTMKMNAVLFYEKTCFCHSEAAKRVLGENWPAKGAVVPVGIGDSFIHYSYPDSGHHPAQKAVNFIYVGTLSRLRNLEILLEAAKILSQKTDRFHLDLIGPDTAKGFYQQVIAELGIRSLAAVRPPVAYDEIPATLAAYDVGLAYVPDRPTWHYQPTIKALEYRAMGLPIISTDVASHREVIEPGVNGLLCADTPQAIAQAMNAFIIDPHFLETVRSNAQQMRRGYTWDDIAGRYETQVYREVAPFIQVA